VKNGYNGHAAADLPKEVLKAVLLKSTVTAEVAVS
jgi:hypothetical protein